jgi:hypothetical protein
MSEGTVTAVTPRGQPRAKARNEASVWTLEDDSVLYLSNRIHQVCVIHTSEFFYLKVFAHLHHRLDLNRIMILIAMGERMSV